MFKRDTPSGTVLTREDVGTLVKVDAGMRGQAVEGADAASIIGRKTLVPHKMKDVLFWSDLEGGDQAAKGLSADIKRQMRAVSINCSGAASVSSMVRPNK